ncbi:MAG TPA: uroporphyrinogen-III synthase, partial [Lacipirellulaceae bacterium]|nr:uroporphyrinogen-III synthase [Lacipirellulaceae bacterium]
SGTKDSENSLDYSGFANFPGTLVFYMGVTTAPTWSQELIGSGKSANTPVAIVRRASLPGQETIITTLGDLADVVQQRKLRPPAVVIVGDVVRERSALNWFNSRPLFKKTVLVTRPEHQTNDLSEKLCRLGARVLSQPAIEIGPPADWSTVDAVIARLAEFDWLVFSSSNGVHFFLQELFARGFDARQLGHSRIATIGPGTAAALAEFHLNVDLQPDEYRAEALAEALAEHVPGKRVLLLRANRGREVLGEMLTAAGAKVEQVVVYESRDVATPDDEIAAALAAGEIDFTTVTSSAIARSLVNMFGGLLRKTRLAAISPLTAEVLANLGFPASITAEKYTAEGLADAILAALGGNS